MVYENTAWYTRTEGTATPRNHGDFGGPSLIMSDTTNKNVDDLVAQRR